MMQSRKRARWLQKNVWEPLKQLRQGNLGRYVGDRFILRFRIRPVRQLEGWLTGAEAAALYRIVTWLPAGANVVEIGSWKGKSTFCMARGLPAGATLYAIDPFDASGEQGSATTYDQRKGDTPLFTQFTESMTQLGVMDHIRPLVGYSHQFIGQIATIHFLFIDGDHSPEGCQFDFDHYGPAVASGGYLAFHDYRPERGDSWGPNWVIAHHVLPSGQYRFIGNYDSLWLAQKKLDS